MRDPGPTSAADRRQSAEAAIAAAFATGEPVFLSFSGGKDSLAVLKLCEPYEGRFKLLWTNTGYIFPRVEALIRAQGERFGLVEIKSDPMTAWEAGGLPTEVLTVANFMTRNEDLKLQPWNLCCYASKAMPIEQFCSRAGPMVLLNGQRVADGWRFSGRPMPANVKCLAPLADWSTEDVFAFIEAEGVELPAHYAEIADSLDCWICPATWGMPYAPTFGGYIAREYPDLARVALPPARRIHAHMNEAVVRMQQALDAATQQGKD